MSSKPKFPSQSLLFHFENILNVAELSKSVVERLEKDSSSTTNILLKLIDNINKSCAEISRLISPPSSSAFQGKSISWTPKTHLNCVGEAKNVKKEEMSNSKEIEENSRKQRECDKVEDSLDKTGYLGHLIEIKNDIKSLSKKVEVQSTTLQESTALLQTVPNTEQQESIAYHIQEEIKDLLRALYIDFYQNDSSRPNIEKYCSKRAVCSSGSPSLNQLNSSDAERFMMTDSQLEPPSPATAYKYKGVGRERLRVTPSLIKPLLTHNKSTSTTLKTHGQATLQWGEDLYEEEAKSKPFRLSQDYFFVNLY